MNYVICKFYWLFDFQLGTEMGVHNPAMKTMKTIMRILAVAMIPLTAQFPTVSLSLHVAWGVAEGGAEGLRGPHSPFVKIVLHSHSLWTEMSQSSLTYG